jgi:serine/threonine-protein kinase
MGEVYEARDQSLERDVAIKILRQNGDPNLMKRFAREAHLAARFDHPNIVRVFDLGRTEDGHPFLVMELVRGKSFSEVLSEAGPLPLDRIADLLRGIAEALDRVHAEGVVHRDIKLQNLMLMERANGLHTKVLDFGVAASPDESRRLTSDGAFVGTPLYSPPEALFGLMPDARGDVYSLAVVTYQLLTGAAPFQELTSEAMLRAKVSKDAPPPSMLRPELSPEIDDFFALALSRDASKRPATPTQLVDELAALGRPAPRPRRNVFFGAGTVAFFLAAVVLWVSMSGA